jgi:transcriptional regulator with XRE-family HTH domain
MRAVGIDSQAELARRVGVKHASVNRWMNGVNEPNDQRVVALARVLGVSRARVYEALGKMTNLSDAEYQDLVELYEEADESTRRETLEFIRFKNEQRLRERDRTSSVGGRSQAPRDDDVGASRGVR